MQPVSLWHQRKEPALTLEKKKKKNEQDVINKKHILSIYKFRNG